MVVVQQTDERQGKGHELNERRMNKKSGFCGLTAGALIFKMFSELRRRQSQRGFKGTAE